MEKHRHAPAISPVELDFSPRSRRFGRYLGSLTTRHNVRRLSPIAEKRSAETHVMRQQALARVICLPRLGFPFSSALPALGVISTPEGRPFLKCEALKIIKTLGKFEAPDATVM